MVVQATGQDRVWGKYGLPKKGGNYQERLEKMWLPGSDDAISCEDFTILCEQGRALDCNEVVMAIVSPRDLGLELPPNSYGWWFSFYRLAVGCGLLFYPWRAIAEALLHKSNLLSGADGIVFASQPIRVGSNKKPCLLQCRVTGDGVDSGITFVKVYPNRLSFQQVQDLQFFFCLPQ